MKLQVNMPENELCSLCCTGCIEYKSLQAESDELSETYNMTVKYFDPILLRQDENTNSYQNPVLCLDCWFHINEFHKFQQKILKTRMLLENTLDLKTLQIEVKQEELQENFTLLNVTYNESRDNDLFKNSAEYGVSKTESLTSCENAFQLIQQQSLEEGEDRNDIQYKSTIKSKLRQNRKIRYTEATKKRRNTKKIKNTNLAEDEERNNLKTSEKFKPTRKYKVKTAKEQNAIIFEWKPELICDLCSEIATDFDNLSRHFSDKHKTGVYVKCCQRKFYRRCVLVNHIQLHLNPETYKCDICGKSSTTKHNLKLHRKVMHEDTKQLKCDICDKLFKQKTTLNRHLFTHSTNKDFICSHCGKGYVAEELLKIHVRRVHNADRVCDQCGKTIHGSKAFKIHLMEHAGIERPKFACDICGIQVKEAITLRRHNSVYHNDGSTVYVCSVCGKVAASQNALKLHKRLVHLTERTHKCTYCDKAFKRATSLREHIATHTGEDLYQCPHCPQTFKVNANMHHHRKRVHPVEWEEARKHRPVYPKFNKNQVKKEIAKVLSKIITDFFF